MAIPSEPKPQPKPQPDPIPRGPKKDGNDQPPQTH